MDFERIVADIQTKVPLKDDTNVGDIILLARENDSGSVEFAYARVLGFTPETKNRRDWWHVDLAVLTVPLGRVTLIVSDEQLTGKEIFTIAGRNVFVKAVNFASVPPLNLGATDPVPTGPKPAGPPFPTGQGPSQGPGQGQSRGGIFNLTLVKPGPTD
jgi:hypothetical protein